MKRFHDDANDLIQLFRFGFYESSLKIFDRRSLSTPTQKSCFSFSCFTHRGGLAIDSNARKAAGLTLSSDRNKYFSASPKGC